MWTATLLSVKDGDPSVATILFDSGAKKLQKEIVISSSFIVNVRNIVFDLEAQDAVIASLTPGLIDLTIK